MVLVDRHNWSRFKNKKQRTYFLEPREKNNFIVPMAKSFFDSEGVVDSVTTCSKSNHIIIILLIPVCLILFRSNKIEKWVCSIRINNIFYFYLNLQKFKKKSLKKLIVDVEKFQKKLSTLQKNKSEESEGSSRASSVI